MLDEPTNHLDADAKFWLMKFLGVLQGGAHGGEPRHRAARRVDHADPAPRSRRCRRVQRAPTRSTARPGRKTRNASRRSRRGRKQEIKRLKTLADSMRGQTAKRARKAKTLDTRAAKLAERKVEGPTQERTVKFRFPEPPHCGKTVLTTEGLAKSYGGPPVFEDVSFDVGARRAPADHGTQRRGQDQPAADPHGADRRRRGDVPVRARRRARLLRPGTRRHHATGSTCSTHMRAESPAEDQQLRSLLGMFGLSGAIAFQDAGTLSRGREDQARARPAGGGPQEPAPARRADEQPRSAQSEPRSPRRSRTGPARW